MSRTLNKLTNKDRIHLYDFLKEHKDQISERRLNVKAVADWATNALGFSVTEHNVSYLMGTGAETVIDHEWPGRERAETLRVRAEDWNDLKIEVASLRADLNRLKEQLGESVKD